VLRVLVRRTKRSVRFQCAFSAHCASKIGLHLCAALHRTLSSYFWRIVRSVRPVRPVRPPRALSCACMSCCHRRPKRAPQRPNAHRQTHLNTCTHSDTQTHHEDRPPKHSRLVNRLLSNLVANLAPIISSAQSRRVGSSAGRPAAKGPTLGRPSNLAEPNPNPSPMLSTSQPLGRPFALVFHKELALAAHHQKGR